MKPNLAIPKVDRRDPTPKYIQAREILIDAIRSGQLAPGAKLPSTKEISSLFNVSLITAHRAMEGLVESGWLRREVGRGTFVRDDIDPTRPTLPSLVIGLLLPDQDRVNLDDYYHSSIINSLRRAAVGDTKRVEFFFHDRFEVRDRRRENVGAICMHPPLEAQRSVEKLAQRCPVVVLGGSFPEAQVPCVDCDNEQGARLAAQHLHELGHRRFLLVAGPLNLSNAADRVTGARAELAEQGIELSPRDLVVSTDSVVLDDAARTRIEARLRERPRPTAIIAGGFYLALATMQAIRRCGLEIPRDVSIVGFDDPASAALLDPPLTTVRQPLEEMAARAYRVVCDAVLEHQTEAMLHRLSTTLVVRGSSGPVGEE
ncbi:MAG: GntR family transcriptional regulator [Phycisphaerales bacterium]|nr:GntR family transcriptional regulator [Phycisphaerales bacterium]